MPLSVYDEIDKNIDFNNDMWFASDVLQDDLINFLLDNSIFTLQSYKEILSKFSVRNKVEIDSAAFKTILLFWLSGRWYYDISKYTGLDIKIILRLINNFFSYEFQRLISAIIHIVEIRNENKDISPVIINWPKMVQYGLDSQLKLDLYELGLSDRVAIIKFEQYLKNFGYSYLSKKELIEFIKTNTVTMRSISPEDVPNISYRNIIDFLDNILSN